MGNGLEMDQLAKIKVIGCGGGGGAGFLSAGGVPGTGARNAPIRGFFLESAIG